MPLDEIIKLIKIMKKIISIFFLLSTFISVYPMPAKRGQWKDILLSNGKTVKAELCGDENLHFWRDAAGNVYTRDFKKKTFKQIPFHTLKSQKNCQKTKARKGRKAPRKVDLGGTHTPYIGEKKGLIILVEFPDLKFAPEHDRNLFDDIANKDNYVTEKGFKGSIKDYFRDQSNGKFILNFDVLGPITLENNYAYYGENDYYGDDLRPGEMVIESCETIKDLVDFKDYDWDDDGFVDQVFILYAGKGENDNGDENTIWPHEWQLTYSNDTTINIDGVTIDTYACGSELNGDDGLCGIGTICHEFSHCLGLADMYDTGAYAFNYGMFNWDIMDHGSYNGNGFIPAGYTSYERWYCGWLDPIELKNDTVVTDMRPLSDGGEAYIIYNNDHKDEYFLLENRQQVNWDEGVPGKGLLVLHVDYDKDVWYYNEVNTTLGAISENNHERCTILAADGSFITTSYNSANDPYPYMDKDTIVNDSITPTSFPNTQVYNPLADGSETLDIAITEIRRHDDNTVSFKFHGHSPTGIAHIVDGQKERNHPIYTIDGRRVAQGPRVLKKGLYIQNGKKLLIK